MLPILHVSILQQTCNLTASGTCPNFGLLEEVLVNDKSSQPNVYHTGLVSGMLANGSFSVRFDNYTHPAKQWFAPGLDALKPLYPRGLKVGLLVVAKIPGTADYMQAQIVSNAGGPQWIVKFDSGLEATLKPGDIVNVCAISTEVPPKPDNCKSVGGCVLAPGGKPETFALGDPVLVGAYIESAYHGCYVAPSNDNCTKSPESDMCHRIPNLPNDQKNSVCNQLCEKYTFFGTQWGDGCVCGNAIKTINVDDAMCNSPCAGDPSQKCGGHDDASGSTFTSVYATKYSAFVPAKVVGIIGIDREIGTPTNQLWVSGETGDMLTMWPGMSYWPGNSMFKDTNPSAGALPLGETVLALRDFNDPFRTPYTRTYAVGRISHKYDDGTYNVWFDHGTDLNAGFHDFESNVAWASVRPLCFSY